MESFLDRARGHPAPVGRLGSATNVWGIGTIVTALMSKAPNCTDADFDNGVVKQPLITEQARERYSRQLVETVEICTRYWADERMGLRELRREITKHTTGQNQAEDLAQGMRSRPCNDGHANSILDATKEAYRLGESLPEA